MKSKLYLIAFAIIYLYSSCKENPFEAFEDIEWQCGDMLKDREGNVYTTKDFCGTCWMTENLNTGFRIDSTNMPSNNSAPEKYCLDDDINSCAKYGGLYQWNELMGYVDTAKAQGICPEGWYIPTDEDWKDLEYCNGIDRDTTDTKGEPCARALGFRDKFLAISECDDKIKHLLPSCGSSDFNALLSGHAHFDDSGDSIYMFAQKGIQARFWTSSIGDESGESWSRSFDGNSKGIGRITIPAFRNFANSCRCIKK